MINFSFLLFRFRTRQLFSIIILVLCNYILGVTSSPTCANIDGNNAAFEVSSCSGSKVLRSNLWVKCASSVCDETDCCGGTVPLPAEPSVTCWQSSTSAYCDDPFGTPRPIRTNGLLKIVDDWIAGGAAKKAVIAEHGFIEDWDTSEVTSLFYLFYNKQTFNADLSKVSTAVQLKMLDSCRFIITYSFTYCLLYIL